MNLAMRNRFAQAYANTHVETSVTEATPHKLISLLYDAALKNINLAKVFFEANNIEKRTEHINKITSILHGLKGGINLDVGGEVSENLWNLYEYMVQTVFKAQAHSDVSKLDEVAELITDLKEAWEQMPSDYKNLSQSQINKMQAQKGA